MKIVGLTGGIGTGKSTVAGMFKDLRVPIYDSDSEAKRLMTESSQLKKAIISLLGEKAYEGEALNRSFIASKVFENPTMLQELNEIVHPAVKEDFKEWAKIQQSPYVIQETALIFEKASQDQYDYVILITAPINLRLGRVMRRDGVSEKEVLDRIKNQMGDDEKLVLADFHIDNIDLETTQKEVAKLHKTLVILSD
ncbi:dephospho-CoA kinase [Flagellimonas eckloniae]|uniref:Dephospho-CoA kinase n=1 Tax=Flagellimonas eckloniae TaxID=346185 RepID=A0A0Q1CDT2_9FLAO|nr:dephospho-CoA kinase [Allomuricauda eckloniae]KQC28884.1 dephospho-CoA kinase [Allomuricauda eckloniae]